MAGQKLTDKTALTEQTGSGDLFMVVDVSDTTGSSAGTSKKFDSKFLLQTDKILAEMRSTLKRIQVIDELHRIFFYLGIGMLVYFAIYNFLQE